MYCRNCGKELTPDSRICSGCGVPVGQGKHYCPNCASPTDELAAVCVKCGVGLGGACQRSAVPGQKSKVAAGILGILLGSLGVHNFYLGYTQRGLIQLLVSLLTCGLGATVMAIWGLVEGIQILTGSISTDANGNPLGD